MTRLIFYVTRNGAVWEVATRDGAAWDAPIRYPGQNEAIAGAHRLARGEWYASQRPTGIRVESAPGDWRDEFLFGVEDRTRSR